MLDVAHEAGLIKARGRQRTDSTHVLAAVRALNRLELVAETLRAALNAIAGVAPDWLRTLAPPGWHARYDRRVEDRRLPKTEPQRDAYVAQVGADGFLLLDAIDRAEAPPAIAALPAVAVLRRVWARHFERAEAGPANGKTSGDAVRLRPAQGRGPGDRIESPYDSEARFRTKAGMSWTGYMVHLTETCDAGAPRLVVHTDTTPANVHEAMRTALIHDALATKGLAPSEHLVDSAYVSANDLVRAHEQYGIALFGPARPEQSWQSRTEEAFSAADFTVDWDRRVARCPEGKESTGWFESAKRPGQRSSIRARFEPPTVAPAHPGPAAPGRGWASTVACSPSFRSANTRPSLRPGPERARRKAGAFTRNAKAWKARCPKACGPSACAGRATAAWPRRACSTSRPLRPSILTVLPLGSQAARSRPLASRALLHSRRTDQFANGVRSFS